MAWKKMFRSLKKENPEKKATQNRFRGLKPASLFSDPGTSFSKPHAILNFNFFVGVKKKTFLGLIAGLKKSWRSKKRHAAAEKQDGPIAGSRKRHFGVE